jgi:hypothetical protein
MFEWMKVKRRKRFMKVFKGNREKGFEELVSFSFRGSSFHRVKMETGVGEGEQDVCVFILDSGQDDLLQVQLSEEEATLFKMALESEGTWIYPEG